MYIIIYMATLQGKFRPKHPEKYKGDAGNILYRSSWERNFMNWCDNREDIVWWQSEEKRVRYYDPIAKKNRTYYPDFCLAKRGSDGIMREELVEIKPWKQVQGPPTNPKRRTQAWLREVNTYVTNMAKWKAASTWAEDRGMSFRLLTEKDVKAWSGSALWG